MTDIEFSKHARYIMVKRRIREEWVWRTISAPDRKHRGDDENMHYTKAIRERDGQVLRVVVNTYVQPPRVVTLFFDRRLGEDR